MSYTDLIPRVGAFVPRGWRQVPAAERGTGTEAAHAELTMRGKRRKRCGQVSGVNGKGLG